MISFETGVQVNSVNVMTSDEGGHSTEQLVELAMDNITPKIFWKDKPNFLKQMTKWNLEKLEIAKKSIIDAEILMKTKFNNYNTIIIKNLLIKLYSLANSTS